MTEFKRADFGKRAGDLLIAHAGLNDQQREDIFRYMAVCSLIQDKAQWPKDLNELASKAKDLNQNEISDAITKAKGDGLNNAPTTGKAAVKLGYVSQNIIDNLMILQAAERTLTAKPEKVTGDLTRSYIDGEKNKHTKLAQSVQHLVDIFKHLASDKNPEEYRDALDACKRLGASLYQMGSQQINANQNNDKLGELGKLASKAAGGVSKLASADPAQDIEILTSAIKRLDVNMSHQTVVKQRKDYIDANIEEISHKGNFIEKFASKHPKACLFASVASVIVGAIATLTIRNFPSLVLGSTAIAAGGFAASELARRNSQEQSLSQSLK